MVTHSNSKGSNKNLFNKFFIPFGLRFFYRRFCSIGSFLFTYDSRDLTRHALNRVMPQCLKLHHRKNVDVKRKEHNAMLAEQAGIEANQTTYEKKLEPQLAIPDRAKVRYQEK